MMATDTSLNSVRIELYEYDGSFGTISVLPVGLAEDAANDKVPRRLTH